MWMTVVGVLFGGAVSWAITHWYYRIAERKAARENPIPLLEQLSSDVVAIKHRIESGGRRDGVVDAALERSQRRIEHVKYVFRAALQNWFSEFTALKYTVQKGDRADIDAQIRRMDTMMKSTSASVRQAALDEDAETPAAVDERSASK
jgi:hypothetical protein